MLALIFSVVSLVITHRIGARANDIAARGLFLEEERSKRESEIFVRPFRFEPNAGGVVFMITSMHPVYEVHLEWRDYSDFPGGAVRYNLVDEGEVLVKRENMNLGTSLDKPPGRYWFAQAMYRRSATEEWVDGPVYEASKDNYFFVERRVKPKVSYNL